MNKPLVSIVIPFYNPEDYFAQLLESVAAQRYPNIEVVLVDDGSEIHHNELAKRFVASKENRVLITKANGGVASARQAGVDASKGKYIIHADADDVLPSSAIETLVNKALKEGAKMVVGGYTVRRGSRESYVAVDAKEQFSGFVEGLLSGKYHGSLWNKLIDRSLYSFEQFAPGLNYMEDKLFIAKILKRGPFEIAFVDESVYVYRQHRGSVTSELSLQSIRSSVLVVSEIAEMYRGVVSEALIDAMVKRQRVVEILHSAKKGVNLFQAEDARLLRERQLSFATRAALWLIKKRMLFVIGVASATANFLRR